MRNLFIIGLSSFLFIFSAFANTTVNTTEIRNTRFQSGVAIGGFDVVHYFNLHESGDTRGDAVKGNESFKSTHNGFTFYFSNQANKEKFELSKEKYLPQFGGYCAFAVGNGYIAKVDPDAWSIVDGKLYLNYSKRVRKQWINDLQNLISQGEKNWPEVLNN